MIGWYSILPKHLEEKNLVVISENQVVLFAVFAALHKRSCLFHYRIDEEDFFVVASVAPHAFEITNEKKTVDSTKKNRTLENQVCGNQYNNEIKGLVLLRRLEINLCLLRREQQLHKLAAIRVTRIPRQIKHCKHGKCHTLMLYEQNGCFVPE